MPEVSAADDTAVGSGDIIIVNESIDAISSEINSTGPIDNLSLNLSDLNDTNKTEELKGIPNETKEPAKEVKEFNIISVSPKKTKTGDVYFEILVNNTGNVLLENLVPIVIGKGFSSYDSIPIQSLAAGEAKAMYVSGHLSEPGNIVLNIKVNDKIFYEMVSVEGAASTVNETKLQEIEEAKKQQLDSLSGELKRLDDQYRELQVGLAGKKADYDVSDVNLDKLKEYIRNVESSLAIGDIEKSKAALVIVSSEYLDQKSRFDSASKKSLFSKLKDNVLIISTIAGAIITIFTFYELVKKKKEGVYKKIKEIKIVKEEKTVENEDGSTDKKETVQITETSNEKPKVSVAQAPPLETNKSETPSNVNAKDLSQPSESKPQ